MNLPDARAKVLESLLEGVSRKDLARRAAALSAAYRAGGPSAGIVSDADALAYVLARAPATYAAARAVLARMPGLTPATVLDMGAGPGTASWAAAEIWPDIAVTMLDRSAPLRALAAMLMPSAQVMAGDVAGTKPRADLVIASYVLAEFALDKAAILARDLWQGAVQALVLIEPGTPDGFARIRSARAALIKAGAHVAAPCTHDADCPMARRVGESRSDQHTADWCHFLQRLPRSRDHLILKDASVPFEDERYSYVVMTREAAPKGARIIKPVVESKAGITLPLCDETGLHDEFVPRRDKEAFRRARKLEWGDLVESPSPAV